MEDHVQPPPVQLRRPYIGDGADGARSSAQIDLEEADCLPVCEQRDHRLLSAERWVMQAEYLESTPSTD